VIAGQYDQVTAPSARTLRWRRSLPPGYLTSARRARSFLSHLERVLPELRSFLGEPARGGPRREPIR
jgi:hypothetical protein